MATFKFTLLGEKNEKTSHARINERDIMLPVGFNRLRSKKALRAEWISYRPGHPYAHVDKG